MFPCGGFSVTASSQENQKQVWNVRHWSPHRLVVWTVSDLYCLCNSRWKISQRLSFWVDYFGLLTLVENAWKRHECVLIVQLCPTLCNPMDCSPPDSSVPGDSSGKNIRAGCHALWRRQWQPTPVLLLGKSQPFTPKYFYMLLVIYIPNTSTCFWLYIPILWPFKMLLSAELCSTLWLLFLFSTTYCFPWHQ